MATNETEPEIEASCPNLECGWFGADYETHGGCCPLCGAECDEEEA